MFFQEGGGKYLLGLNEIMLCLRKNKFSFQLISVGHIYFQVNILFRSRSEISRCHEVYHGNIHDACAWYAKEN